jgi:anti-sigma regulatory factor (Ser/Thr protein kinase)/PAS domain-containing protein
MRFARLRSIRLALGYAGAAALWILLSDRVLAALGLPPLVTAELSSLKGLLFVAVTASILYMISVRQLLRIYSATERYGRVFTNAPGGIAVFRLTENHAGKDLVIEDANPALLEHLGLTREQVVGRRMSSAAEASPELDQYFGRVRDAVLHGTTEPFEVHIAANDTFTLGSVFRLDEGLWALRTIDVTAQRRAQQELRREDDRIREAYVDVLDAVTGGKLVLMTGEELDRTLGEPLDEQHELAGPQGLSSARAQVRAAVNGVFPGLGNCEMELNPVGEALNNVLKHADGGEYRVFRKGDVVQVLVRDHGSGIDFRTLPKATLLPGFSTTATLGMGFTIMLQLSDRVLVCTGDTGTTVVLEVTATTERQAQCVRA